MAFFIVKIHRRNYLIRQGPDKYPSMIAITIILLFHKLSVFESSLRPTFTFPQLLPFSCYCTNLLPTPFYEINSVGLVENLLGNVYYSWRGIYF
jgi:hypothetical protein